MKIDLNADLGEGFGSWRMGDDEALLAIVTSANVACGFHAGDPSLMRRTCDLAVERGVRIGAHVGYRDLVGFGRRDLAIAPADLADETLYQIGALDGFARRSGDRVRHVKPHGAMYHAAARDAALADAVAGALTAYDSALVLVGPPDSELERAANSAGLSYLVEAFADRGYTESGGLVPRSSPGAVLDNESAVAQAVRIATEGSATVAGGGSVPVSAGTICVHGDSPGAVEMARAVRQALDERGLEVVAP